MSEGGIYAYRVQLDLYRHQHEGSESAKVARGSAELDAWRAVWTVEGLGAILSSVVEEYKARKGM